MSDEGDVELGLDALEIERLARLLEWRDTFTIVPLVVSSPYAAEAAAEELRGREPDALRVELPPDKPDDWIDAFESALTDRRDGRPLTLVVCPALEDERSRMAWGRLLAAVNLHRDDLRELHPGPMLWLMLPWMEAVAAVEAPDLWSVVEGRFELMPGGALRMRLQRTVRQAATSPTVLELHFTELHGSPWRARMTIRWGERAEDRIIDEPQIGSPLPEPHDFPARAAIGTALWRLIKGEIAEAWLDAVGAAGRGDVVLTVATPADEAVFHVPWELLHVEGEPLGWYEVVFVRRVSSSIARAPRQPGTGVRVLYVSPHLTGPSPSFGVELLLTLSAATDLDVEYLRPASAEALHEALVSATSRGQPHDIVHFDASVTASAALVLEDARGVPALFDAPELSDWLRVSRVRLVVLAIDEHHAGSDRLAIEMVRRAGVSVRVEVTDPVVLYAGLRHGHTQRDLLRLASGQEDTRLYQDDDVRLRPLRDRARPLVPRLMGFPDRLGAAFIDREAETTALERALRRHPVVYLHGAPGTGKTALATEAAHWWVRTGLFREAEYVSLRGGAGEGPALVPGHDRLLVYDDCDAEAQAERIAGACAGTTGCRALIVGRRPLGRDPAVVLGGLAPEAADRMLAPGGAALEPDARAALARRLDGNPLALQLVARQLSRRNAADVLADLDDVLASARQPHTTRHDRSLRDSLQAVVEQLTPAARATLPALRLLEGGAPARIASEVVGLDETNWSSVLLELRAHGLARLDGKVLRVHPGVHAVADWPPREVATRFIAAVDAFSSACEDDAARAAVAPVLARARRLAER